MSPEKADRRESERPAPSTMPVPKRRHHDGDASRTQGIPHADAENRREENRNQQDNLQDNMEDAEDEREPRQDTGA